MIDSELTVKLLDLQKQAILKLLDLATKQISKRTVTTKALAGPGKTIILTGYVGRCLTNVNNDTAFIWLCPSKGNLGEQSRDRI